ncbi:hypothetical protein BRADI_3g43552v3 [Brachypodium distachyon]|uniref:Uncharacterized protein n=1 Tax=Brachypodium distachyon TaxID=15368 RepID=A0A2K2D2W9_BRADI|nr:hypothetical protein BRADI_3g43552v3 [Brachypodium distachyon]
MTAMEFALPPQTTAFMPSRCVFSTPTASRYAAARGGRSTAARVKGWSTRTAVVLSCRRMTRPSVKPTILWRRSSGRRARMRLSVRVWKKAITQASSARTASPSLSGTHALGRTRPIMSSDRDAQPPVARARRLLGASGCGAEVHSFCASLTSRPEQKEATSSPFCTDPSNSACGDLHLLRPVPVRAVPQLYGPTLPLRLGLRESIRAPVVFVVGRANQRIRLVKSLDCRARIVENSESLKS